MLALYPGSQATGAATTSTLFSDCGRGKRARGGGEQAVIGKVLSRLFTYHQPVSIHMAKPDFERMRMKNSPVGGGREYW